MRSHLKLLFALIMISTTATSQYVQSMPYDHYSFLKQVNIGSATPAQAHTSLAFQVYGTARASRPFPVMTTTQRNAIASPIVYATVINSTTGLLEWWNGSSWVSIVSSTAPVITVFGRTGAVVATSGDYNSDQVTEGSTNLFHTTTRVRLALSAGTGMQYNSGTGVFNNSLAIATQVQKTFFAGPASGADAVATFRTIAAGDLPDLSATYQTPSAAAGLYVPLTRTITINGTALDLSANRSFTTFNPTLTSPAATHYIRHNGTSWVNSTIQAGDLPTSNTISSLQLTTPSVIYTTPLNFSNTGGAWTGTLSLATQAAGTILAGPISGSAATPTFRAPAPSDFAPTLTTLTDGATITWDYSVSSETKVTLGGSRTLSITNLPSDGKVYYGTIAITQDATGSRGITLPASSKVVNGGAGTVTLTTTAAATDILVFRWNGTNLFWTIGKNFN
jgi:hypothetical protein